MKAQKAQGVKAGIYEGTEPYIYIPEPKEGVMKTLKSATRKDLARTLYNFVEQTAEFYHLSEKDAVTVVNKALRSNCVKEGLDEQIEFLIECEKEEVRL